MEVGKHICCAHTLRISTTSSAPRTMSCDRPACARKEVQPTQMESTTVTARPVTAQPQAPSAVCTDGNRKRLHTMSAAPDTLSGRLSSAEEKFSPAQPHSYPVSQSVSHIHLLQPPGDDQMSDSQSVSQSIRPPPATRCLTVIVTVSTQNRIQPSTKILGDIHSSE